MLIRSNTTFTKAAAGFAPIVLLLLLTSCAGNSTKSSISSPPPPGPPAQSSELFAQHIQGLSTPWPTIGFKEARIWSNVSDARWAQINPAQGQYDFTVLDGFLSEFYQHSMTDVLYTIGQLPPWASSKPNDTTCDFSTDTNATFGGCDLPADIDANGNGSDATYINFVTALAQHVNDPTYLQTHAPIKYWEPWNEWYRNPTVYPGDKFWNNFDHVSIYATYAQMVRMTADLRCVVVGTGCVAGVSYPVKGIDPTSKIVSPSDGADINESLSVFQNFLYCNASPIPGSNCNASNAGSPLVDVLNSHWYEPPGLGMLPESVIAQVSAYYQALSATDQGKPIWSGEGSWGDDSKITDPDQQMAWVARYYLSGWTAGLKRMYWYGYDSPHYGTLWTSGTGLNQAGQAYGTVSKWLYQAKPASGSASVCSPNSTLWTCNIILGNGSSAEIIWDTSSSPTGPQSVSSNFGNMQDLTGTNTAISGTVQVGNKPILLTTSASTAP
ncbi:MAG TPA: beta-galactosidase [Candidatus Eisenbacteria bacterium]|nr:beta-galactosidase [Candidatus Eisenbacteria bacterium]